jgi:hypothetical protein
MFKGFSAEREIIISPIFYCFLLYTQKVEKCAIPLIYMGVMPILVSNKT